MHRDKFVIDYAFTFLLKKHCSFLKKDDFPPLTTLFRHKVIKKKEVNLIVIVFDKKGKSNFH